MNENKNPAPEPLDAWDRPEQLAATDYSSRAAEKLPARIARAGIDELEARLASATRRADSMAQAMQAIMLACDDYALSWPKDDAELARITREAIAAYQERELRHRISERTAAAPVQRLPYLDREGEV